MLKSETSSHQNGSVLELESLRIPAWVHSVEDNIVGLVFSYLETLNKQSNTVKKKLLNNHSQLSTVRRPIKFTSYSQRVEDLLLETGLPNSSPSSYKMVDIFLPSTTKPIISS